MTVIAITGITGNMGRAVADALCRIRGVDEFRLLVRDPKRIEKSLKANKSLPTVRVIRGSMTDRKAIAELVSGASLVINMAAVIPPRSDSDPRGAVECNEIGVKTLVSEIERITSGQPSLIHISTVAVYGSRGARHPFGRVGDPLLVSPLDVYSATKLRAEFCVLESSIDRWCILRQSAMLHPRMLKDNVHDGLMFHTTFDAPLEWVTAHDSGVLIQNIMTRFAADAMPDGFWKKCFNIAGGKTNRCYGIQTFDLGFSVIGGNSRDFFKPYYNATRNFHGVWYADGDALNDMFGYQSQTVVDYWREVFRAHPVFKLGKLVPNALIRTFLFKRLLKDKNAPSYWAEHGDTAKMIAHFGGTEEYAALKKKNWADIALPDPAKIPDLSDNATPVYYGFDFDKPDGMLTQADLESAAEAHGGKFLGTFDGDMYKKHNWLTQDGEVFTATAYTVLRAGHWYNAVYDSFVWDFDRLAKKDKVFASLWYDTHREDENIRYSLDKDFHAVWQRTEG